MKAIVYSLLASAMLFTSCAKDNVDPPKSRLTGRVVYQDQAVGVRSFGSTNLGSNASMLELWQRGFGLFTKIPVFVDQDGTFSAELFNGDYKLVRSRGNGPWVDNTDSISVNVKGNTVVDVPVQPYFTFSNASIQKNGSTVTATCTVAKTATRNIDRVVLFISRTAIVDATNNLARSEKSGADVADLSKPLTFSLAVPTSIKGPVYARLGVRASGAGEYLYTPVQKLE
ncbi:DUF3823 domain-containing protein [Hymenobacter sp. BT507]|uniref:DUF3823 domain-containing protein n=1 Tax=Hymenobacter citatus TaxID=2763506 RepID=A0ABR7MKI4_9BACT|nr:DUF3823 domain-containing protein [Hymenobacter citatus]MBC6611399.1 DUF3823 domain-containing protein [Hymenobacter citatus]